MTTADPLPHRKNWEEHYPTERSYGRIYPTPADWVFGDFERGGMFVSWKRFEGIGHDYTDDHEVVEARDFSRDAGDPDETAMLAPVSEVEYVDTGNGVQPQPTADPADRELTINGESILRVYQPFTETELLAAVAAILERHSNGEEYDEIVQTMEMVDPGENQTLEEWL